jgi:hypothetical protein
MKTYTDDLVSLFDCYELIKPTIYNNYEDYYCYDEVEKKMDRGCFVYVTNAITAEKHYEECEDGGVYYDTDLGDANSIGTALDDYLQDQVLLEELDEDDFVGVVDEAFLDNDIDWLRLLSEYIDDNDLPPTFKPLKLRYILKIYLGRRIYQQGLIEIREKFEVSLNDAVVTLQRAIKRKVNKRQVIKVLESKVSHIDPSTFYPLISKWI